MIDVSFEELPNQDLDDVLSFSQILRCCKNQTRRRLLWEKYLSSIRFGLQRHFISVRNVDILKSGEFSRSNRAFKAKISKLKSIGKAEVKHYPPITDDDVNKINEHLDLSEPNGLQRRAFVGFVACMLHFANRGRENCGFIMHYY